MTLKAKTIYFDYTTDQERRKDKESKGKGYKVGRYSLELIGSLAGRNIAKKRGFYSKGYFLPPYNRIRNKGYIGQVKACSFYLSKQG